MMMTMKMFNHDCDRQLSIMMIIIINIINANEKIICLNKNAARIPQPFNLMGYRISMDIYPHGKSQDSHHPNWVGVKKKNRSFGSLPWWDCCLGYMIP